MVVTNDKMTVSTSRQTSHFGNSFALEAQQVVYAGGAVNAGIIRNGLVSALMGGVYGYSMCHQVAENLSRGIGLDPMQALLVSIKQLYGITCLLGIAFLLVLLLWNVQPVRSTMKKIPSWHKVARSVRPISNSF